VRLTFTSFVLPTTKAIQDRADEDHHHKRAEQLAKIVSSVPSSVLSAANNAEMMKRRASKFGVR
jgi:hypothetical protein